MLLAPRIHQYELSELCHRLAVSLESGIELRRVFARESNGRSSTRLRNRLEVISRAVAQGSSLHDAIAETGSFFPPFFRAMVEVGEQTGHSAEIFRHLSEHYDRQLRLRRMFLQSITMPMIQLTAALGIIGLMIWLMGFIGIDVLGFGLMGTPGLLRYLGLLAVIFILLAIVAEATRRGVLWTRPIEYGALKVPVLGGALQTLALSRLAWSLQLTYGVGMDLQRALDMSLRSMQNRYYTDRCEDVVRSLRRGQEISQALALTGVFPNDFLDALEVGEKSGRLPETMATLSNQYQDRAQRALATLTTLAGFVVWALVASIIIFFIWRIFSFYLGALNNAMKM
jgi:type II secretory pathway component PulF